MKRRQRTEILVNGSINVAKKMAEEIMEHYHVKTIEEPNNGLVMIEMRETAKKNLFYLGEMFVTEAKVQVQDSLGIGMVYGNCPELAYYLAVVDAAYNADLKEAGGWSELLLEEEKNIKMKKDKEQAKILKTTVNFETMDVE
ncbi:MAG: phosphonate C-P lyase system protein PhnG [Clostridia bacterium]|nr:phosphonate C-P lyase system protein PhnG [Clostridia bacterium]